MSDIRLVQGLLITICVSLVVGIAFTLAEMSQTDTSVLAKVGVTTSAPAPTGTGTAPPAPSAQSSAVDMAPQGTWGVFVFDVAKALSVPDIRDKVAGSFPAGLNPGWISQLTMFMTPPAATGSEPGAAGILTLAPGAGPQLESWLKGKGTPVTVAGATAYKVDLQAAPAAGAGAMGGMPGAAAAPHTAVVAVIDDTTAVAADDEQALGALLKARQSGGGVSSELKQFLGQYSGAAIYGAVLATPDMLKDLQARSSEMAGLKGGAFKVDLGATYDVMAAVRFTTAQQAQQAVADVKSKVDEIKKQASAATDPQSAAMMKPMLDVLNKLTMNAQGSDATFGIKLAQQDLQQLGMLAMMMMMGGGQGGGMMMAPPGGGMMGPPSGSQ